MSIKNFFEYVSTRYRSRSPSWHVPEDEIIKAKKIRNYERERALREAVLVEKSKKCNYELIDKSLSVEEIVEEKKLQIKL